jgi:hypothetical protein
MTTLAVLSVLVEEIVGGCYGTTLGIGTGFDRDDDSSRDSGLGAISGSVSVASRRKGHGDLPVSKTDASKAKHIPIQAK